MYSEKGKKSTAWISRSYIQQTTCKLKTKYHSIKLVQCLVRKMMFCPNLRATEDGLNRMKYRFDFLSRIHNWQQSYYKRLFSIFKASNVEHNSIWWRHRVFNTLIPRQNGRHIADDIINCIFLNENVWLSIKISTKFVPKDQINDIPALVWLMAWRLPGDKPLSEPMMVRLPTHICVTRPQWVNAFIIQAIDYFQYIFLFYFIYLFIYSFFFFFFGGGGGGG